MAKKAQPGEKPLKSPFGRAPKDLIVFDLDGTLAEDKKLADPEMASLIARLLEGKSVGVISGSSYPQFEKQLLPALAQARIPDQLLGRLFLLPTSGAAMFRHDRGGWTVGYSHNLTSTEKEKIFHALQQVLNEKSGAVGAQKTYGDVIEDRGGQITFSALGANAPVELKKTWDPARQKRKGLVALLSSLLPEFNIHIGGMTSIDVTERGIDKAYGVRELSRHLGIPIAKALYVGDAIFPEGNDYPAAQTGADFIPVRNVEETKRTIREILGE